MQRSALFVGQGNRQPNEPRGPCSIAAWIVHAGWFLGSSGPSRRVQRQRISDCLCAGGVSLLGSDPVELISSRWIARVPCLTLILTHAQRPPFRSVQESPGRFALIQVSTCGLIVAPPLCVYFHRGSRVVQSSKVIASPVLVVGKKESSAIQNSLIFRPESLYLGGGWERSQNDGFMEICQPSSGGFRIHRLNINERNHETVTPIIG